MPQVHVVFVIVLDVVDSYVPKQIAQICSNVKRIFSVECNLSNEYEISTNISIHSRHNTNNGIEDDENNSSINEDTGRVKKTRYSAPVTSDQPKENPPLLNNTITSTTQNGTNGNHSEEYESPEKVE